MQRGVGHFSRRLVCRTRTWIFMLILSCFAIVQFGFPQPGASQRGQGIPSQMRQLPLSIECEDWVGSAKASAGNVVRQEMSGFGAGWSGDAQLFWTPPPPVDKPIRNWPNLRHGFKPPAAGTYEIILHYTAAPDFGTFRVFLDGDAVHDIDGYAPKVTPRSQSLGQHQLDAGNHEFLITVFTKSAFAKSFSVGLDRIELRSKSSTRDVGRIMDGTRDPQSGQRRRVDEPQRGGGHPQIAAPQLFFANASGITNDFTAKAGTERTFNRLDLHQHLIRESVSDANQVAWRWQVAVKPFPDSASGPPPSLVAEGNVSSSAFTINFGSFPPLNSPQTMRRRAIDFYIRLVPMLNGQPAGPASNTIVAHYVPGIKDPFGPFDYGNSKQNQAAGNYKLDILSFTPAIFPDPNREGCVFVIKNPYFNENPIFSPVPKLAKYKPQTDHCPTHPSMSYQAKTIWDYPGGWFKAYKVISAFYDEVKKLAAAQFAEKFCGLLGNPPDCQKNARMLAGVAINVGLTAAGIPPSLPDLDDIAKGNVVDAAVDYSCMVLESQGGTCTPELRAGFAKGYQIGLDQLQKEIEKSAKEPDCESGPGALPCFTKYPGTEIRPATGAVFQPPTVAVRVTLTKPYHSWTHPEGELKASLWLHNVVPAGTKIESQYATVPKTQLDGQLFVPVQIPIPSLAVGQSADVTLVFDRVQQYHFSTTTDAQGKPNGFADHNGWCYLYEGGKGPLSVSFLPNSFGNGAEQQIQIPKTGTCSFR